MFYDIILYHNQYWVTNHIKGEWEYLAGYNSYSKLMGKPMLKREIFILSFHLKGEMFLG